MDQQQNYVFNLNSFSTIRITGRIYEAPRSVAIDFYRQIALTELKRVTIQREQWHCMTPSESHVYSSLVINHSIIYKTWNSICIQHSYNNELFLKHNRNKHSVGVESSVVNVYPHQLKHRRCGL